MEFFNKLFGSSFYLAPLIILLVLIIDLRIDAQRLLWLYRRPIGYKAQDIGSWFLLCRLLNALGIINNGFLIAYTSNWSKSFLGNSDLNRMYFVVCFEVGFNLNKKSFTSLIKLIFSKHAVFFVWLLIIFILPDIPKDVFKKMQQVIQYFLFLIL